jgi:Fic family protein
MSNPAVGYTWHPITDLSHDDRALASEELPALVATWDEVRFDLATEQVELFNERLQREWAIETGIIEQLYTLDRGTTQLLIERGIDASLIGHSETDQPADFVAGIIQDQKYAVEWLFTVVKQERPLTTSFIKELHALMTARQKYADGQDEYGNSVQIELRHGDYKLLPNNPTRHDGSMHEYCPPVQVASELEQLVRLHDEHISTKVHPDVEAAWLHHRFAQIHPFQDGNGRVARALASLILVRAGWFPLVVTRDDRPRYIDALEAADAGDLAPLVRLFAAIEKRAFVKALSIAEQVQREAERVDQMIDAIGDMFGRRDQDIRAEFEEAKSTAERAWELATSRFEQVASELEKRMAESAVDRKVFADSGANDDPQRRIWNRFQVVDTANCIDYFANMRGFHAWARLGFVTENGRSELLLSFHAVGSDYRGVVGASMSFYRRQEADNIEHQIIELQPVCDDLFQINYKEDPASVLRRFRPWLEEALVAGLDQWRRGE